MRAQIWVVQVVFVATLEGTCVTLLRHCTYIVETTLAEWKDTLISFRVHLLLIYLLYIMKNF